MRSTRVLWISVFTLTTLVLGAFYWFLMSDWLPYISINWYPAQCLVSGLTHYNFTRVSVGVAKQEFYTRINVQVNTSGAWVNGYACGSSRALQGLEYDFTECEYPDACGKELLLPLWTCSFCRACSFLVSEEPQACQWSFHAAEKTGKQYSYPTRSASLLHVVFAEEVYWGAWKFMLAHLVAVVVLMMMFGAEIVVYYACHS